MKEKLVSNLGLKILSIGLAFVIWLAVVNVSNPEVTRTKSIALEITNANVLTGAGKTYSLSDSGNVTVSYQVRTMDEYKIKPEDFKASIDLENLYNVTGSVPVSVEVVNNKDLIIGTPYARPGVIQVSTEDIQQKRFNLATTTVGTPEEEYSVGSVNVDPKYVSVSGPVSLVGRISSVGVEVNVDGATKSMSGSTVPVFYDANGNKISLKTDSVQINPKTVSYSVIMLRGKSLTLNFEVSGSAADGYRYTGAECNVKSVSVIGQQNVLDTLSSLDIPEGVLSVQGATEDRQVKVNIKDYLPAGVSINGDSEVTVILKVEALNQKNFTLSLEDMQQVGETVGFSYLLDPDSTTVTVTGLSEDLSLIDAADLKAELDLTHLTIGRHDGKLTFNLQKGLNIKSYTPFKIVVYDTGGTVPALENGPGTTGTASTEADSTAESSGETAAETSKDVQTSSGAAAKETSAGSTESGAAKETSHGSIEQETGSNPVGGQ